MKPEFVYHLQTDFYHLKKMTAWGYSPNKHLKFWSENNLISLFNIILSGNSTSNFTTIEIFIARNIYYFLSFLLTGPNQSDKTTYWKHIKGKVRNMY